MKNKDNQITHNAFSHQLTNINIWSCDGKWLIYDVRPHGSSFTGLTIERVNVETRRREVLYRAGQGAHVGVATGSPARRSVMCLSTARKIPMNTGGTISITAAAW